MCHRDVDSLKAVVFLGNAARSDTNLGYAALITASYQSASNIHNGCKLYFDVLPPVTPQGVLKTVHAPINIYTGPKSVSRIYRTVPSDQSILERCTVLRIVAKNDRVTSCLKMLVILLTKNWR